MCGIAGIIRLSGSSRIDPDALRSMIAVQRHRGPDEAGMYIDDHVGLGHSRLSIIDLAGGVQPIANEDETLWIVYNGEVYNYPELREELIARGHRFGTATDTEVVLHAYEEYGTECLARFNGQFAFAIVNATTREWFCARDRVGIRPFHYVINRGMLYFASEIKALFSVDNSERAFDVHALDQVFTFWTTLPGTTAFSGVKELPAGCFMTGTGDHTVSIRSYWDVPLCNRREQVEEHPGVLAEELREKLLDAVRIRLRADVPVGTYLSGGLDSSTVSSMVVSRFHAQTKTFGIRFTESAFDEGSYQNMVARYLEADHAVITVAPDDIARCFSDTIMQCEKPVLRTAPVPLMLLSGLVHEAGLKVVLTGEGADEFFGGYNIFRETLVRRFLSRFPDSPSRASLIQQLYPHQFTSPLLRKSVTAFFKQGLDGTGHPFFSHLLRWNNTSRIKRFFSHELQSQLSGYDCLAELESTLPAAFHTWDHLTKAQYLEITLFLSNYLLSSQGDRMAMAHSLEIRLPFLDHRICECAGRIPSKWKILGIHEKHLLKKACASYLPPDIINRPKQPYRAPIQHALPGQVPELRTLLTPESIHNAGFFDANKVERLVKKHESATTTNETDNMAITGILSTMLVHKLFVEKQCRKQNDTIDLVRFRDNRSGT